ncbi:peptide chain release factor 1-like, mitochondrial [Copidosoma floridanum]|uniref:peptide chain release factor 1-like, mitochondrial n=1 Tax=Copidosoma floridanum TaxID=29053 RepID=UPI0006C93F93|nr:peptide chain release factor 1-like, mitochondrial [Copidosoma floridanum]
MITGKGVMFALSRGRRFLCDWRTFELSRAGISIPIANLQSKPRCYIRNLSRYMSTASLAVKEADLKKFLNYLIKTHSDGTSTEFDRLLQYKPVRTLLNERLRITDNIKNLKELEREEEMKKLVEEEKCANEKQLKQIDDELIELVLKNVTSNAYDDVIMEITAGVGGQEAMLFLKNLLEMYVNHLTYLGYKFDIIEINDAQQGGIRNASIMISGSGAFEKLRHEAGNHRVQRVPATEKSGRMHTSVVSVAVLPQPSEIEIKINPKDLRIDTMRATGAGGQHVNTTDSAVRITHLPTGTVVECQTDRSQLKNRKNAMAKLRSKLYQVQLDKQMKSASSMRKQQMGMGQRNEKIRTYNFNQDRVTDHRLTDGTLHNLKGFFEGGEALDSLHSKLNEDLNVKILLELLKSVE